ncbi:pyrroline-5-carboxylate reductase [Caballeronia udeis]|uniref:Pyrroline-5-carboxylate reductase n=1 Tax=Caballeronia udeis TaxID=1232866 RepID=A0ABW8MNF4_9BURK
MKTILFIGGGRMSSALVGAMVTGGVSPEQIEVIEPDEQRRNLLRSSFKVTVSAGRDSENSSLSMHNVVVWAVKPQTFLAQKVEFAKADTNLLHLSIMAGVTVANISELTQARRIVRAMPNMPASVGRGVTALFAPSGLSPDDQEIASGIFAAAGEVVWLEKESMLDAATAISGSGPAYLLYIMEAMQESGMRLGLSEEQTRQLVLATIEGVGAWGKSVTSSFRDLREAVTSPGGTTAAAIEVLETRRVREAVADAVKSAALRSQELTRTNLRSSSGLS